MKSSIQLQQLCDLEFGSNETKEIFKGLLPLFFLSYQCYLWIARLKSPLGGSVLLFRDEQLSGEEEIKPG